MSKKTDEVIADPFDFDFDEEQEAAESTPDPNPELEELRAYKEQTESEKREAAVPRRSQRQGSPARQRSCTPRGTRMVR